MKHTRATHQIQVLTLNFHTYDALNINCILQDEKNMV